MKRMLAIPLATALVAGGFISAASADLARVGPINPETAFPVWFEDSTALRLQLCDEFDPEGDPEEQPPCLPELANPQNGVVAGNIEEALYYAVDGEITTAGGVFIRAQCALEAAGNGELISNAALIRIRNLTAAGDYTVVTPCATFSFNVPNDVANGEFRDEIAVDGSPTDVPPFSGALGPNAPISMFAGNGTGDPGFLGSGGEIGQAPLDGPLQDNGPTTVTVTGPGEFSGDGVIITDFAVVGKLFAVQPARVDKAEYRVQTGKFDVRGSSILVVDENEDPTVITVHLGTDDTGPQLGTAIVNATTGRWSVVTKAPFSPGGAVRRIAAFSTADPGDPAGEPPVPPEPTIRPLVLR
jgi:hypothetical protein